MTPYVLAFLVVFSAWLGLSAWMIVDRAAHDRLVADLRRGARGHRLRWGTVAKLAADAASDPELSRALVRYVMDTDERGVAATARDPREGWRAVEAVRILARAGHRECVSDLERMLRLGDEEMRAAAVTVLAEIDDERSTALLIEALRSGRCPASWAVPILERRSLPARLLQPLLDDPSLGVRAVGTRLLARSDAADATVERMLLRLCRDRDADVRAAACRALGERGSAKAVRHLESLLDDPVWFVRIRAARALGQLGSVASAAGIARLLASRTWWVRQAAKETLVDLGPAVLPQLLPMLDHADAFARNSCAEVLQNLGLIDQLLVDSDTADPATRAASRALLDKIVAAGGSRVESAVGAGAGTLAGGVVAAGRRRVASTFEAA